MHTHPPLGALATTAHGRAGVPRGPAVRPVRRLTTQAHASAGAAPSPPQHHRSKHASHLGGAQLAWPPPPPAAEAGRQRRGGRGRWRSSHPRRSTRATAATAKTAAAWPPNSPSTMASAWPGPSQAPLPYQPHGAHRPSLPRPAAPAALVRPAETIPAGRQPTPRPPTGSKRRGSWGLTYAIVIPIPTRNTSNTSNGMYGRHRM